MNGAVIYQSKYGATKTYAEWLAESLAIDFFNVKNMPPLNFEKYAFLVFGSPVYVGKILVAKYIKKNWNMLQRKRLYLLVVGGTSPEKAQEIETIVTSNFEQAYLQTIKWYYLLGRSDIQKLHLVDKFLIKAVASVQKDEQEKAILSQGFDGVHRENLQKMIADITSENK